MVGGWGLFSRGEGRLGSDIGIVIGSRWGGHWWKTRDGMGVVWRGGTAEEGGV